MTDPDAPVNTAGEAAARLAGEIPGAANPISGQPIELDVTALFTIKSADLWCGDVVGGVTRPTPIDLEGSTVGAIRIADSTFGDDLPDPVAVCPEETPIDAGGRDAAPHDAMDR